jgi:ribosomal protein L35
MMMSSNRNNGSITGDTKFKPGNPGRRHGARHKVTRAIEELLEGEHEALTRKAIEKALEGDMVALRLCLDRIAPPRKDGPISVMLPPVKSAAEAVEASAVLLEAVAGGEVTPDEAARVMALLVSHKTILEAGDLERRVAELEAKGVAR